MFDPLGPLKSEETLLTYDFFISRTLNHCDLPHVQPGILNHHLDLDLMRCLYIVSALEMFSSLQMRLWLTRERVARFCWLGASNEDGGL